MFKKLCNHFNKIVFALVLLISPACLYAQDNIKSVTAQVQAEQKTFMQYLDTSSADENIVRRLKRFVTLETDSITNSIINNASFPEEEKIRGIKSLMFVMRGMKEKMQLQKPETYDIPGSLDSYKSFLHSMLHKEGYTEVLEPLGAQRSQLLANTFWQCDECSMLNDIVVYKRFASAPDYILPNLEKNPNFYFRDSLILLAVMHNPSKVADYLSRNKSGLADIIRSNNNKYVQQVISLASDKNADDLLPFTEQLTEGKITVEEILRQRADVNGYFQLLVNTLKEKLRDNSQPGFQSALKNAIHNKAEYFYIRFVNEQHDDADNIRFSSVKELRAEDLYYLITSKGEDLYTSTYLGLYNRMMAQFRDGGADSLFTLVQYDQFYRFISLAANYNVLADFLRHMDEQSAKEILHRYIGGIENDTQTGLSKAMNVADLFTVLSSSQEISSWIEQELVSNYKKTKAAQQFFGTKMYEILLQVFDLVKQNDPDHKLWLTLGNHEILEHKSLQNSKGEIVEMVLFYGDKDGVASYNSFMGLFKDSKKWEIEKNEHWIKIRSLSGKPIIIYANLPLNNEEGKDTEAQAMLSAYLKNENIEPAILIHRGHSYHLEHTFKQLQPSMKLVILGSCGGYNNNLSIANFSPEAQIIVSKKVGSKYINDPLIEEINNDLLRGDNLIWKDIWSGVSVQLKNNPFAFNLFNEYLPPAKNVNLFVLKLFNAETGTTALNY